MKQTFLLWCLISIPFLSKAQNLDFLVSNVDVKSLMETSINFSDTSRLNKNIIQTFELAIQKNNPFAWSALARIFQKGSGITKDEVISIECYKKSALLGNAVAQYGLAEDYKNGRKLPQNFNYAFELAAASAKSGYPAALALTAYFYYKGFGTVQNYQNAFDFARQSAEKGRLNGRE